MMHYTNQTEFKIEQLYLQTHADRNKNVMNRLFTQKLY